MLIQFTRLTETSRPICCVVGAWVITLILAIPFTPSYSILSSHSVPSHSVLSHPVPPITQQCHEHCRAISDWVIEFHDYVLPDDAMFFTVIIQLFQLTLLDQSLKTSSKRLPPHPLDILTFLLFK